MSTNPYTDQPKRKKSLLKKLLILGAIFFAGLILFVGCVAALSGGSDTSTDEPRTVEQPQTEQQPESEPQIEQSTAPQSTGDTVTIRATATGSGSLSWDVDGNNNSRDFTGSYEETIENVDPSSWFSLSVMPDFMNSTPDSKVTCELIVNGEVVDTATGTGESGSAYCSTL